MGDCMAIEKLHPNALSNLSVGKHMDGGGLFLRKYSLDSGKWVYRYTFGKARKDMGLGGWPQTSLKSARAQRNKWLSVLKDAHVPRDPITERDREQREAAIEAGTKLSQIVEETFNAIKAGLRGEGKAGRWDSPLRLHVIPKIGHMPISHITQHDVANVLRPIWHKKADTARKATNWLLMCFDHAMAQGLPVSRETIRSAKVILGPQGAQVTHVPSVKWQDVGEFYASLGGTPTELALRLLILTASRSKPIRFFHLSQIQDDVWVVPAENMKGLKGTVQDFHIPLSKEAQRVIKLAMQFERGGYLFPSQRKGVISDATMSAYMKRRGMEERPHGFRASFKTWANDKAEAPRELSEACLAHSVGKVEASYLRGPSFLERRRILLENWAQTACLGQFRGSVAQNVVPWAC